MRRTALLITIILLILLEIAGIYFIMPFPGSQKSNTIAFAYWLHNNTIWIRIILLAVLAWLLFTSFRKQRNIWKIILSIVFILYCVIFYYANFKFKADKMFLQPRKKEFVTAADNKVPLEKLVVGVSINGEQKAFPIQVIGYHHQVRDTIGNTPVMVTYCTVCRTGRVFSPVVNGKPEQFRLVGMDHFNAMFEDNTTKSWWQQATGVAVAGQLKGHALTEIPSEQNTLASWLQRYPNTLILQPDTTFKKRYKDLKDFDNGTTDDELEKRDSASWEFKSWVVGVSINNRSRAYDWNDIVSKQVINDTLASQPLVITLENDTATFHVLSRKTSTGVLTFENFNGQGMKDSGTGSTWDYAGLCVDGELKGQQLQVLQSSQEFWHSWRTFHPQTSRYR
jgi:hypothetical protein